MSRYLENCEIQNLLEAAENFLEVYEEKFPDLDLVKKQKILKLKLKVGSGL